jgi:drug/metabolite transporter superfamily protein YnfA
VSARRVCGVVAAVFAVAYAFALAVLLIGTFGLFGAERDPLSGVYLIPLGLPWNRMIDPFPEWLWPWLGAAAPLVNLAILLLVCRVIASRRRT